MLAVRNDMLDVPKIEAGKLDLEPAEMSPRECIEDTARTLAIRAHEKGLELACHLQPDLPDLLIGDSHRLRQIIINLVGNAIKFTAAGEVVVDVSVESMALVTNHDPLTTTILHFAVRDTGIGIPAEK